MRDIKQDVHFDDEQLQDKLVYWLEKLRLQDWIVTARIARYHELEPNRAGECSSILSNKEAVISILSADDYAEDWGVVDMEWTLVHELLHLHFESMAVAAEKEIAVEQAIESITYGLIALERKEQGDTDGL